MGHEVQVVAVLDKEIIQVKNPDILELYKRSLLSADEEEWKKMRRRYWRNLEEMHQAGLDAAARRRQRELDIDTRSKK